MGLCGSYSVSFLSKAICQDVTEKAVSKPEAVMFDVYFLGSFISESSQRGSLPYSDPISSPHLAAVQVMNEQHKGTCALCHMHALCLRVALGIMSACSTSWHCAEHIRKHLLLVESLKKGSMSPSCREMGRKNPRTRNCTHTLVNGDSLVRLEHHIASMGLVMWLSQ